MKTFCIPRRRANIIILEQGPLCWTWPHNSVDCTALYNYYLVPINDTRTNMRHVLKRMKKQFSDLCDFYFLSYGRFCSQFSSVFTFKKFLQKESNFYEIGAMSLNEWKLIFRFLVFETWSISYWNSGEKIMLGGLGIWLLSTWCTKHLEMIATAIQVHLCRP